MKVWVVLRRELIGHFLSPIAWVVAVMFAIASAFFFEIHTLGRTVASLGSVYESTWWVFIVAFPALTMGTLAAEFRNGTIETLATDPVRDGDIVLGKFFGVMAFFVVSLLPLLFFWGLLRWAGGNPDPGPLLSGLFGMLLAGGLCAAIGIFSSSITSNQTIAFGVAFLMLLVLRLSDIPQPIELPTWLRVTLDYIDLPAHLRGFYRGRIALDDLIYFLSSTALFLFLSTRFLESRRWA
ncbi:MAG: ABC transporter permease [Planctomycetes bacterium]|nr:ABC transporter permease [Planctomycetota bacterium]